MNQYRVDFSPDIEASIVRKALLREHSSMFGGYIFDGTCMFTSQKLDQDLLELTGKRNDDSHVKITIKHVREIPMTDGQSMQILNLVLRKAMEGLNLQLVGRNFFDAASKVRFKPVIFNSELLKM
jgi:aubergine-like protein